MKVTGHVVIDPERIPKPKMARFCRWIIKQAKEFYEDPQNMAEFEAWEAEYLKGRGGEEASPEACGLSFDSAQDSTC